MESVDVEAAVPVVSDFASVTGLGRPPPRLAGVLQPVQNWACWLT